MTLREIAVVSRDNRYGLTRDAGILCRGLESIGIRATALNRRERGFMNRLRKRKVADAVVHLERIHPAWLGAAAIHALIPNQERFPRRHAGRLERASCVLAKTRHAREVFAGLGADSVHLGFTSPDRLDSSVPRNWNRFFHLAGGSTLKGTEDVLALWDAHPEWPELVLVQKKANAPASVPANVTLLSGYLDDGELKRLQNACGIHLCPSRSEGWGHHIVEAMSCGAVVVTTDAPPMNEHVTAGCGVVVRAGRSRPRHLGYQFFVDRDALEAAIADLVSGPADLARSIGAAARARFEEIDRNFAARLGAVFDRLGRAEASCRSHDGSVEARSADEPADG